MSAFFAEVRETILPERTGRNGPLPPLLVAMTLVTGLVDSFSYLVLGHVFVANMTGNVVLLGFALVGAPGFSITASVAAVASFAVGALVGGRIGSRFGEHRGRHLSIAAAVQSVFLATAVIVASLSAIPVSPGDRYGLIVALAVAMGVQNAAARRLAVPDLTTTVLTLTITGMSADSTVAGGKGAKGGRRTISIAAMLAGAVIGAAFVVHSHLVYPLGIALVITGSVAATSGLLGRSTPSWARVEAVS
ncbi:MAG: YoaK family protein [Acidimicrobiales bacterium]